MIRYPTSFQIHGTLSTLIGQHRTRRVEYIHVTKSRHCCTQIEMTPHQTARSSASPPSLHTVQPASHTTPHHNSLTKNTIHTPPHPRSLPPTYQPITKTHSSPSTPTMASTPTTNSWHRTAPTISARYAALRRGRYG